MSGEAKDPAIKLFGKTIPLPEIALEPSPSSSPSISSSSAGVVPLENDQIQHTTHPNNSTLPDEDIEEEQQQQQHDINTNIKTDNEEAQQQQHKENQSTTDQDDCAEIKTLKERANSDALLGTNENPKTPSLDKESSTPKNTKTEEEQSETSNSQDKPLKKPDKILPCPRCNSMDTKFCYYNNYNVNQPRHFCKNCQRYWTAGGTMRNVPVGAGRRKNKSSATNYRHITVSEALQNVRTDIPNGVHHPQLKPNGTVLAFGTDTPLSESMATVLNIAEKTLQSRTQNGFHKPEELKIPVPCGNAENRIDHLSGPSIGMPSSNDVTARNGVKDLSVQTCQNFLPQMPCFPGAPWPYPWNSAQWNPPVPPPAFCPPGFPMPFYPAAPYWGCSMPATWNVPWFPQPSSPNLTAPGSGPNSPTLGKHSRDDNMMKPSNSGEDQPVKDNNGERCLWIPKTLRIDDPREAAKSSIWSTLGIKNDKADPASGGGLLKAFQPKSEEKKRIPETSPVLQANPAALSRSLNFHERL